MSLTSLFRPRAALLALLGLLLSPATAPLSAQGWIEPLPGRPIPVGAWDVEKTRSQVRVTVDGRAARVVITEWFKNEGERVAEGEYLYPLPGEAAFSGFSLWQGEDELRGEMMDADRARSIYEEIVRRRADPALIELAGHGLLRARVFPIEPGQERKVELRYTQLLGRSGDALHFRYAGGIRDGEIERFRPEPMPVRDRRDRDERSGRRHDPARTDFQMIVEQGDDFLDPFSPTHGLERERRDGRLVVTLDDEMKGELSVFLPLARQGVGLTVAAHRPAGEDGYAMLTLTPGRVDVAPEPRDVTVVVDVSGSMAGEKMTQARAAILALLETLDAQDRFRLIAFSNAVKQHSADWLPAQRVAIDGAGAWVERLEADGGTNIEGALAEAFRVQPGEGRLPVVIFLTDGLPTVGERDPNRIAAEAEHDRGRARVFAFGVGHDVNTALLDRLSAAARGSTDYVQPGESVERAMALLAAKVRHPILTDLTIAGAPVRLREIYPVTLPDLFAGQELVLFARYTGEGEGEVAVAGRRAGRSERFGAVATFPRHSEDNAYLPRLWASRKLGHLTRQVWLEGASASLIDEIKETALRYGLPSEYTSYLVVEPTAVVAQGGVRGEAARRQANAFGAAPPPATAAEAHGAGAVGSASRARAMRDASSSGDLEKMEEALAVGMDPSAGVRMVAGRLFQDRSGVWIESAASSDSLPLVTVKLFSRAWFDLMAALPEIAPAARELGRLELAGARVRLRVDANGLEQLTPERIRALALEFRGVR